VDAVHVAAAATHGMDFLLTWDCKHIANAVIRSRLEELCRTRYLQPPMICTPEEPQECANASAPISNSGTHTVSYRTVCH